MAFVLSQNQIAGVSTGQVRVLNSLQISDNYTADYATIWRTHGSVRTVTTFLARNIASLGVQVFDRVADQNRSRITDHPLAAMLGKPAPHTTAYTFWNALVHDVAIYDRYLAIKGKNGSLFRVPPHLWEPVKGHWLYPEQFKVRGSNGDHIFDAPDTFHILGYSPAGQFGGTSSLESLRLMLAEEHEAGLMRQQVWRNGARSLGYIKRPSGDWSQDAQERFTKGWQAQFTRDGTTPFGTPILADGMEWVNASQSAKDLQYIEARKLTREEVAAAYFIPPPMVGLLDHATFSNIKEQHKSLYQDTLGPWLEQLTQELEMQIVPDLQRNGERLYVEFNLEAKLRGSFEEQASQLQSSVGAPWMTPNEARAYNNLAAVEGGDSLVVPLNVVQGGQASPRDSGSQKHSAHPVLPASKSGAKAASDTTSDEAPQDADADALASLFKEFFAEQRTAVSKAWRSKSPTWWDGDGWDAELASRLLAESLNITPRVATATLEEMGEDPGGYSVERTRKWLEAFTDRVAKSVNATTMNAVVAALAAPSEDDDEDEDEEDIIDGVFDDAEENRSSTAGMTAATALVGFAVTESARQSRGSSALKRWNVNSSNPRASHASMDGEEVGIDDEFSNGLPWPGAFSSDADEVAGCNCSVTIVT